MIIIAPVKAIVDCTLAIQLGASDPELLAAGIPPLVITAIREELQWADRAAAAAAEALA